MIAILGKDASADEAVARKMLAAAPHRGQCVGVRKLGKCIIGIANRPDLVDESLSADGTLIAALSGRLDNVSELYRTLAGTDTPATSREDADVVVAAFRAFGAQAPNKMRGRFAGVVTDGRNLWCFRDHIGFKPLFFHDNHHAFVAASEPRQVIVGSNLDEEPDFDVLEKIFLGRMQSDTPAALKGVQRQPQATTLEVSAERGVRSKTYWNPLELLETARIRNGDVRDRFLEVVDQAVKRVVTGKDVILLSGGLDSPAVAAFAAPEHRRRTGRAIGALSAVFPDLPSVDESRYIQLVADRFGIELHTFRPTARQLDDIEEWCRRFASPVPILSVPETADAYDRARRLGYTNILTGEFAEFVFGSPRHVVQHLLTHGRFSALFNFLKAERNLGSSATNLAMLLVQTFMPGKATNWYLHRRGMDMPQRIPSWMDERKVNEVPFRTDLLPPPWQRWRQLQRIGTEGATLTLEADEACAAMTGVTARRPLADIDLWEFFLSLPAEIKHPDTRFKVLAHRSMRGILPDEILDRRDKTFFDDHVMGNIDYGTLKRLLVKPRHRLTGVNYEILAQRIERRDFTRYDWFWARDLASVHAFLNAW